MPGRPEPPNASQIRLLASARELAARGALSLAHPERIATNASMARGAVAHHFGDRAALLEGLLTWCAAQWSDAASTVTARRDLDLAELLASCWRLWSSDEANPRLLLLFIAEAASGTPALTPLVEAYRVQLQDRVERLLAGFQREDVIAHDVNVTVAADLLIRAWVGVVTSATLDESSSMPTAFDGILESLIASWRPCRTLAMTLGPDDQGSLVSSVRPLTGPYVSSP